MAVVIEHAVVKFFARPNKEKKNNYGFAKVIDKEGQFTGEEVHFRLESGRFLEEGRFLPEFREEREYEYRGELKTLRSPRTGEFIMFVRVKSGKPSAYRWTLADLWDLTVERIASRPMYRVVKYTDAYQAPKTSKVIWVDNDIVGMSAVFPFRPEHSRYANTDPLSSWSADGGDISGHSQIEVLKEGEWIAANDPRVPNCCVPRNELRAGYVQDPCVHGSDQSRRY